MSRESLEAALTVSEDALADEASPVLNLPVGVGISLALSDFSTSIDASSMSSGEESSAATLEQTPRTEKSRPIRDDKGHSTVTCVRQPAGSREEMDETPTSSTAAPEESGDKENATCTIAFDMHQIRRFPPSEATLAEQVDRLREYNYELQAELRRLLGGDSDRTRLVSENLEYKMKLEEMNEYIDRIDIEAEQEFDVITRELELHQQVAAEERAAAIALEHHLDEKEEENKKLRMSNDALQAAHMKQKEIIENMSQQLDSQAELQEQVERLKRTLKEERDNFKRKELVFVCDLDEVQRELNTQKEVLHAGGVGEIIRVWNGKIERLENEVRERDSIIFTQQHIINEMRRQASGSSINTTNSSLGNKSLEGGGEKGAAHY